MTRTWLLGLPATESIDPIRQMTATCPRTRARAILRTIGDDLDGALGAIRGRGPERSAGGSGQGEPG